MYFDYASLEKKGEIVSLYIQLIRIPFHCLLEPLLLRDSDQFLLNYCMFEEFQMLPKKLPKGEIVDVVTLVQYLSKNLSLTKMVKQLTYNLYDQTSQIQKKTSKFIERIRHNIWDYFAICLEMSQSKLGDYFSIYFKKS